MTGGYWDVFRSLLDQMAHEDDLLVSRTLWLVISQFLLLLGYFLIDRDKWPREPDLNPFWLLGVIGLLSTALIYSAILAAVLDFVELRTQMAQITAKYPDLPMRILPSVGIGSGLLCPILLSLLLLYVWITLTVASRSAAILTVVSGALFAVSVVGDAQGPPAGRAAVTLFATSLAAAVAVLAVAVLIGMRSRRPQSP
jgi:hypothetical protein